MMMMMMITRAGGLPPVRPSALCAALRAAPWFARPGSPPAATAHRSIRCPRPRSFSATDSGHERRRRNPKVIAADRAYCVNLVRERDGEAYLCGLLMPAASRDAYFALRAFNAEVASIKDGHHVRSSSSSSGMAPPEPTSGVPPTFALQLRMQWWRNAVDAIYSADDDEDDDDNASSSMQRPDPSSLASSLSVSCWNSPVVRSLDRANAQIQWTRRFLERLLDARAADLELRQYDGVDDCAAYAEETVSSLLYLTLECTGVRDDAADSVASHAGIGVGLATLLRATPHRLAHGGGGGNEVPLPADLFRPDFPYHQLRQLQSHGARSSQNDDVVLTEADALLFRNAVEHVARLAARHLVEARERQGSVPSAGRVCLLPVIPALTYLSRLERADYNLFDPAVTAGSPTDRLKLLLRLGRTWATGIF